MLVRRSVETVSSREDTASHATPRFLCLDRQRACRRSLHHHFPEVGTTHSAPADCFFRGFLVLSLVLESFDETEEERMSRLGHLAMIVTLQFLDLRQGMSNHLHHAPEISVLFVSTQ